MTATRTLLLVIGAALAVALGWWGRGFHTPGEHAMASDASGEVGICPGGAQPLYWKAPMDPNYIRDEPGKSPMGMELVPECPAAPAGPDVPAGAIVIDAATLQNIGVRTRRAEKRDLFRSLRAVGRVAYDERQVSHVHTKVQGWVERLFVDFVGQKVERGQRLLEIYSPDLVATQEELLLAARYRDETGASPFDDVSGGGESLFLATKRRLELWDIPARDIETLLRSGSVTRTRTLYAPASGFVTHLGVRRGMEVMPNENLYTIADLASVWVLADVYEYELPWLELGQQARVEFSYLPGETLAGPVTYIAPFLDPKTRTVEVRIELQNAEGKLKPEMFGNVVIAGAPRDGALAIASDAVIRSGTRNVAIVALGDGRFEPREVVLGLESGDGWVEVLGGVAEGEDIVVSGQFLIDSESNLREAVAKLRAAQRDDEGVAPGEPPMPAPAPADEHDHHKIGHEHDSLGEQ